MKIGLFFGTFDPIHIGHIKIAISIKGLFDQIWFIVSPKSPFKKKNRISSKEDRIHMVNIAIKGENNFFSSDIEFDLPSPNYTCNTLKHIKKLYPKYYDFNIILGSDNYQSLLDREWKNAEYILTDFKILIYQRDKENTIFNSLEKVQNRIKLLSHHHVIDGEPLSVSSSFIREKVAFLNRINRNSNKKSNEIYDHQNFLEQELKLIRKILNKNLDSKVLQYINAQQLYIY